MNFCLCGGPITNLPWILRDNRRIIKTWTLTIQSHQLNYRPIWISLGLPPTFFFWGGRWGRWWPGLTQDPTWHLIFESPLSSLICDNFSVFPVFHDLNTFEECWSAILQHVPHFEFISNVFSGLESSYTIFWQENQRNGIVLFSLHPIGRFRLSICLVPGEANLDHLVKVMQWVERRTPQKDISISQCPEPVNMTLFCRCR